MDVHSSQSFPATQPSPFPWRPTLNPLARLPHHDASTPPLLLSLGSLLLSAWEISLINSFMVIRLASRAANLNTLIKVAENVSPSCCPVALSPLSSLWTLDSSCICLSGLLFTILTPASTHLLMCFSSVRSPCLTFFFFYGESLTKLSTLKMPFQRPES